MEVIIPKEAQAMKTTAEKYLAGAQALTIQSPEDYQAAADTVKEYIKTEKELKAEEKKLIDPLNQTKTGIKNWFKGPLEFIDRAKKAIKQEMIIYDDRLEEERRKKQAEIDAALERERKRKEKLAEKRAQTAMKKGDTEKAEQIREEAEQESNMTVAPVAQKPKLNAGRVGIKTTWYAEVVNLKGLCQAVVNGDVAITAIQPNMKVLNALARASQNHLNISGVVAKSKRG